MTTNPVDSSVRPADPQPQEIERRARSLWEEEGRPEGRALEHWFTAERELRAQCGTANGSGETSPENGYNREAGFPASPASAEQAVIVAGGAGRSAAAEKSSAPKLPAAGAGRKTGAKPEPDPSAPLVAGKRRAGGGASGRGR